MPARVAAPAVPRQVVQEQGVPGAQVRPDPRGPPVGKAEGVLFLKLPTTFDCTFYCVHTPRLRAMMDDEAYFTHPPIHLFVYTCLFPLRPSPPRPPINPLPPPPPSPTACGSCSSWRWRTAAAPRRTPPSATACSPSPRRRTRKAEPARARAARPVRLVWVCACVSHRRISLSFADAIRRAVQQACMRGFPRWRACIILFW